MGLTKIFPLLEMIMRSRSRRIPVRELRRWFEASIQRLPAKVLARTKHLTQAADLPPTFILFVRNPKEVQVSQLRYLENSLRKTFGFEGTSIRWVTKGGSGDR